MAEEIINYLWRENITKDKSVIMVGNKADLARARVITTAGEYLCATETSSSLFNVMPLTQSHCRGKNAGPVARGQVHRDVQRHPAQRGRAAGGHSEAGAPEGDARQEGGRLRHQDAKLADAHVAAHGQGDPAEDLSERHYQIEKL